MAERWWSAPMRGEHGKTVMVSGRDEMDRIIAKGRHVFLVKVSWRYNANSEGYPDEIDAELMGRVNDALEETFHKDNAAYMVAIFTGEGCRDWLFYTTSLPIFGKIFNRALEPIEETIPFEIEAQSDPEWEEYQEMKRLTYIPPDEDED